MSRPSKTKSIELLRKAVGAIPELKPLRGSPRFKKWQRDTTTNISNIFVNEPKHSLEFKKIKYGPSVGLIVAGGPPPDYQRPYERGLETARSMLESMIEEIETWWDDDEPTAPSSNQGSPLIDTNEVFIVHGRDEGAREKMARFIETLGLRPIILHERATEGRTIVEKLEHYGHVGFAVVLLTPDDVGKLQDGNGDLKPRARQNVILELGYFMGDLGRKRVCALVKDGVETPSDYDGVVYIPLDDADGWKLKLAQELKSAGYDIDLQGLLA